MRVIAVTFLVASLLAVVAHFGYGWSFGLVSLLIVLGLPMFGLLITLDDDLPGGFSNPDGDVPPPWHFREFWGEIILRASLGSVGFAVEYGWTTRESGLSICFAAAGSLMGGFLMHQRQPTK